MSHLDPSKTHGRQLLLTTSHRLIQKFSGAYKQSLGLQKGDKVLIKIIYLPMQ